MAIWVAATTGNKKRNYHHHHHMPSLPHRRRHRRRHRRTHMNAIYLYILEEKKRVSARATRQCTTQTNNILENKSTVATNTNSHSHKLTPAHTSTHLEQMEIPMDNVGRGLLGCSAHSNTQHKLTLTLLHYFLVPFAEPQHRVTDYPFTSLCLINFFFSLLLRSVFVFSTFFFVRRIM